MKDSKRIIATVVVATALGCFLLPAAHGAISVISYWRLGENDPGAAPGLVATNTMDGTGTNTIAFTGSPTYSTNVSASAAADVGSTLCISFTNGCYGQCPIVSSAIDNFGIELWVNPASTSGNQCLAYNGNTSYSGWGLYQIGGSYSVLFGGQTIFGSGVINTGVWTHLALVRASGTTTLYVNGVPSGSTTISPATPTGGFALAAPPLNAFVERFSGSLDEVRVFTFAPGQFSTNDLLLAQGSQVMPPIVAAVNWHFVNTGSMALPHRLQPALLLTNGLVLVAGGQVTGNANDAELYNFATGSWSETAPMSVDHTDPAVSILQDGRVLVAGGLSSSLGGFILTSEIYNPATATWTNTGSLNDGQMYGTATLLTNGTVLVAGGVDTNGNVTATAEIYNPATGTWSNTAFMNNARRSHGMILLPDGRVLVAGGDGNGGTMSAVEIYNPATSRWTNAAPMNVARDYVTTTLLTNGQVFVTGGGVLTAEIYNPGSNTWTLTGPMSLGRLGSTATLLQNGQVLVAGGLQDSDDSYASTEIYNPTTSTWTNGPSMNIGRRYHAATALPSGQILISGGDLGLSLTGAAELYVAPESAAPQLMGKYFKAGGFQISFTNNPSALFNILASSNLQQPVANWTVIGNAIEGPVGHFQWNDTAATNGSNRFYLIHNQ